MRTGDKAVEGGKRVRRSPDILRAEALSAARRLIVEQPRHALTMKAVAEAVGVTYPNISHHFGSAAGLYAAVGRELVAELFATLELINDGLKNSTDTSDDLTTTVFEIFDRGGLATALEWLLRSGDADALRSLSSAVAERIGTFTTRGGSPARNSARFSRLFLVLGLTAQADALAGDFFGQALGIQPASRRALLVEIIDDLRRGAVD